MKNTFKRGIDDEQIGILPHDLFEICGYFKRNLFKRQTIN